MAKRLSALALSLVLLLLTLSGCGGGSESAGGGGADTDSLVVAINADATSMDPLRISDTMTMSILSNVYETLVRMTPDSEIIPAAAETWDISEDGMEYTFHLREGLKFHNGDPVTAEDVKYSMDSVVASSYCGSYLSFVDHTEVVDDSSVKVVLKYPYAPCLSILSVYSYIVKEDFYADGGQTQAKEPIGSGPYKFVSWTSGDKIEFEAFEDYYAGPASIKNLTFKVIGNSSTAAIALEKGEIDLLLDVAPADIKTLESSENLQVQQKPSSTFFYLGLNTESEVFSDVRVRQAVAQAVDRESLIYGVLDGCATECMSFIMEGLPGYTEGFDPLPFDQEAAKQLLADAGYPDGLSVTLTVPESRSKHAQTIQADLKQIGIDVQIEMVETGAFWDSMTSGDYEMTIVGWSYVAMDPDVGIYSLYQSQETTAGNYVRLNDARLDELLQAGRMTNDTAQRDEIYREAEEIAITSAAYVPLYWKTTVIAHQKNLQNVTIPPCGLYFFYDYSWAA